MTSSHSSREDEVAGGNYRRRVDLATGARLWTWPPRPAGSSWFVADNTRVEENYEHQNLAAFVAGALGAILARNVKTEFVRGTVDVSVTSRDVYHLTTVPITHRSQIDALRSAVAEIQAAAAEHAAPPERR